ncbi:hypothetical protein A3Q56_05029, partial [Intoshia linei]
MLANDIPKTNNAIEGFHSIFKKSFNCLYYSKDNMYNALKNVEEFIRQKYERTLFSCSDCSINGIRQLLVIMEEFFDVT